MPDDFGSIHRLRDVYRVHDTTKKQKKPPRDGHEEEFTDILEETEKESDQFLPEREKEVIKNPPANAMLGRLAASIPPPIIIEPDKDDSSSK